MQTRKLETRIGTFILVCIYSGFGYGIHNYLNNLILSKSGYSCEVSEYLSNYD